MTLRKDSSATSSLFSTVKKAKYPTQLQHAKSYDDIFSIHQLQPCEVKILLNNDKSLKSLKKLNEAEKILKNQQILSKQDGITTGRQLPYPHTSRQSKSPLQQVLEESVRKQNLLAKRQLFDPFKYFGSSSQLSSIQQSTRHHQSRLEFMFSQSPNHTERVENKKSPTKKQKIDIDVHRISNSVLIAKLQEIERNNKKNQDNQSLKKISHNNLLQQKENLASNISNPIQPLKFTQNLTDQKTFSKANYIYQPKKPLHSTLNNLSKKTTSINEDSQFISQKKMSFESNSGKTYKTRQVNCSPKSYVKQAKEKYLKMNLNSLQKVRLKLKLTSSAKQ